MFRVAPGVRLARETALAVLVAVVDSAYTARGHEAVITSGIEGVHSRGSEHYVGHALDWRTRGLPLPTAQAIRDEVAERLGPDFDVLLESNPPHLHAEWDPK